jgi:hypothetical protein
VKFKVGIARFPGSGSERHECTDFLVRTARAIDKDPRIEKIVPVPVRVDTPVPMLRNKAVLDAKEQRADYLVMVDSDMAPDAYWPKAPLFWNTAWDFLMKRREEEEHDREHWLGFRKIDADGELTELGASEWLMKNFPPATVSAPYCGAPPRELVMVFHWANQESDHPNPDFRLKMIPREMAALCAGIQEVAAMATGLIIYDMRVFDILKPAWFAYEYKDETESEKVTSEDVYETRNASMLGLPQFVAWDCWAGHMKTKMVGRPELITRDKVHASLREAVLRGIDSNQRIVTLTEKLHLGADGPTQTLDELLASPKEPQ